MRVLGLCGNVTLAAERAGPRRLVEVQDELIARANVIRRSRDPTPEQREADDASYAARRQLR